MARRRSPAAQWRQLRASMSSVGVGICIGAAGVLALMGQLEDERDTKSKTPRAVVPKQDTRELVQTHEALRYGLPSSANVHVRSGYVVSYDYRTRNASWVLEYLTKDSLRQVEDANRSKSNFAADVLTPEPFRVHPNVYLKSGYDKGHLAPARDMTSSQLAMNESFLMTNISPQVGVGFNRGYWARVEGFVRHLAGQYDIVYVVTGPLFLPKKDKQSGEYTVSYPVLGTPPDAVAVPTHFFKVILGKKPNGKFTITGFILPNRVIPENKDLREFIAPVDVIEKYSGLLFFDKLNNVEKADLCSDTKCSLAGAYRRAVAAK